MKSKTSRLDTLPDFYKKQFKRISTQTYLTIFQNREKTVELAKKTIEKVEPENLNEEYIIKVADALQISARIMLEERGALTKN